MCGRDNPPDVVPIQLARRSAELAAGFLLASFCYSFYSLSVVLPGTTIFRRSKFPVFEIFCPVLQSGADDSNRV
jgi:hypothetical protein